MTDSPRFRFAGVKAFVDGQDVEPAPITLVFGRNSAGKGTLIQSLPLLKQTL